MQFEWKAQLNIKKEIKEIKRWQQVTVDVVSYWGYCNNVGYW